ncbi:MAG: hypothetical protein WBZ24_14890 [Anaerolineales bacterium]
MNPKVRSTLTDDLTQDRACSICGQKTLQVVHLDAYPDYVNCDNCGSAFVVEDDGERVMYGKIPAQYPETRHFALQQWVWPEAIDRKASRERPSGPPSSWTPPPPPPAEPAPPAEPESLPTAQVLVEAGVQALRSELEAADDAPLGEPPLDDDMGAEAGPAEEGTLTEPPPAEAAESEPSETPSWPPPPVEASEPALPESPSWPPPVEEPQTGDTMPDQQTPVDEPPTSEPLEGPADIFASSDQPSLTEEITEDESSDAVWEPEVSPEAPIGDDEGPSEAEVGLGDEEDLLDSLWGDEPYPTAEVSTAKLPEPPAWAAEIQPEDEETSPADEAGTPDSVSEATPPAESDQDTADRLHTWGAPPPEEPVQAERQDEDQGEAPDFPWDPPSDDTQDSQPPSVAPFEDGGWPDDEFVLPDETTSEPSETAQAEVPPPEPTEPPSLETPSVEELPAMSTADPDEEASDHANGTPEVTQDRAADESSEPEPEDELMEGMAQTYWGGADGPPPPKEEPSAEELKQAEPVHHEPPPGDRYRVVVKGANVRYPENICSHCLYAPATARLPILASISRTGVGDRQIETLRIPVCADCKERASARSEEQRTAQLQAHLIGVLVALVLIVCGLGVGFINLRENLVPALIGLIVMAGLGYVVPAVPLLLRASRLPKPPDSEYVQSTLRVPGDTEGTETAFEWRNRDYARRFLQANTKVAVSEVTRVREEGT